MTPVIKVAIVEDGEEQREALFQLIRGTPGFACLAACKSAEEALGVIPPLTPDVVLMDIQLPGQSGIECVRQLKRLLPKTRVMMLTVFEDHERIFQSLAAGATGYLLKTSGPAKILEAIKDLHEGGAPMSGQIARQVVAIFHQDDPKEIPHLSPREEEILALLSHGYLYKEVADRLGLSLGTVRTHVARIYEKLHVHTRTEAVNAVNRRPSGPPLV